MNGAAGSMMRVAVITMAYPAVAESFLAVELRALMSQGVALSVYALRTRPPDAKVRAVEMGISDIQASWYTWQTPLSALIMLLAHPLRVARTILWTVRSRPTTVLLAIRCAALLPRLLEVAREIEKGDSDVVHLFWGHYPTIAAYYLRQWDRRRRVVTMSLGAYDLLYRFGPSVAFSKWADAIWTHTAANIPLLQDRGVDTRRVSVLHRGIDLSMIPAMAPANNREPGLIVTVARLVPEKGVALVIRAVAMLKFRRVPCRLVIVGDGPEREALESLSRELGCPDAIQFCGWLSQRDVYATLARADVFALLSTNPSERLPNVVKEALASGCICIVTETPGIRELLQDLERPMIVDADATAAAEAIEAVIRLGSEFAVDRVRGRCNMIAHFDSTAVARARIDVWKRLLARPHLTVDAR